MKRRYRLTRSTDIKRVRRSGKSYAHPLIVLYALHSTHPGVKIAVTAGTTVGNAVQRNRAKRLIREAVKPFIPRLSMGASIMLIGRAPLVNSNLAETTQALLVLLQRAKLLDQTHED